MATWQNAISNYFDRVSNICYQQTWLQVSVLFKNERKKERNQFKVFPLIKKQKPSHF